MFKFALTILKRFFSICSNQFERSEPYTNLLWLHYVIDKMINGVRYNNTKTKKHRAAIHDMMQLRDELLDYNSASDYVKCLFN